MCATLCLHRGLSDDELERLPGGCQLARNLAGGPVHVYYSRGVTPGLMSGEPCERPGQDPLSGPHHEGGRYNRWLLWLPVDCGKCQPCRDRASVEADPDTFLKKWAVYAGL